MHRAETTPPRLETPSYQDTKQPGSSTTTRLEEHKEPSPINLGGEKDGSQAFDEDIQTEDIEPSSNFTLSLKDHAEKVGLKSITGDQPADHTFLNSMRRLVCWSVPISGSKCRTWIQKIRMATCKQIQPLNSASFIVYRTVELLFMVTLTAVI
jgi:hypothetical protein